MPNPPGAPERGRYAEGQQLRWLRRGRNSAGYYLHVTFVRYVGEKMALVYRTSDRSKQERRVPLRVLFDD
jgi:hypothetical protein